jgi:MEDS: MEthanogen/methylotroph, DcmR Sensory domain
MANPSANGDLSCGCEQPILFGGAPLGEKMHICAFFNSPEEEYQLLLPFIKEGFERGEKAFHVVDPKQREDHLQRLESIGIDVESARSSGQLHFCDWNEAYLPDGRFDMQRMLNMWNGALEGATRAGYPRTRLVAHME